MKKLTRPLLILSSSLLVAHSFLATAEAAGPPALGNEEVSARQLGQGGVGLTGQSDDPATAYLNPAGLTNLPGTQATVGLSWVGLSGTYTSENNARGDTGVQSHMTDHNAVVPNFAITHAFMDGKLGTGLAVESPYGLETHWPGDGPLRYVATNSKLHMVSISPAVAYKILPQVSLGAGADYYNVFDVAIERHYANVVPGTPDANSKLSGTGTNWGAHLGAIYEPTERHAIGVSYRTKVKLTIKGTARLSELAPPLSSIFGGTSYETAAYTDIFLPQTVQFGYAFKPTKQWMIEADAAWFDMSASRDGNIRYAETDPTRLSVLNFGNPTPLNWHNMWSFAIGANFKQTERLQWRGGFFYVPHTVPEATFDPSIADLTKVGLGTGVGVGLTSHLTLDFAYTPTFYITRTIQNNVGFQISGNPAADISGEYKVFTHIVTLNLTYRI